MYARMCVGGHTLDSAGSCGLEVVAWEFWLSRHIHWGLSVLDQHLGKKEYSLVLAKM